MDTPEKQWYEKPIKVTYDWRHYQAVTNGDLGGFSFPKRHYWPDIEEQRADIADLWVVITELQFEAALAALGPLSGVGELGGGDDSA
jgi:hypothetical protein